MESIAEQTTHQSFAKLPTQVPYDYQDRRDLPLQLIQGVTASPILRRSLSDVTIWTTKLYNQVSNL